MFFGSTLVLKAVETKWKLHILVDWIDKKGEKRPEYKGKDCHVRRVRVMEWDLESWCLCGFQTNLFRYWQRFGNIFHITQ